MAEESNGEYLIFCVHQSKFKTMNFLLYLKHYCFPASLTIAMAAATIVSSTKVEVCKYKSLLLAKSK
jgi:hypothetical protein